MPDLSDKLKGLSIVASYQSPVQHLPKYLSPQVTHSPTPFTQILLLWISISIFITTIAGAVVGYIFETQL